MKECIKSPSRKGGGGWTKSFEKNLLDVFQVRDCETHHKLWKEEKVHSVTLPAKVGVGMKNGARPVTLQS